VDPIPYETPPPPTRHPLRVFAGVLGAVLGSMSLLSNVISLVCHGILDEGMRAERFAGAAFALGVIGLFASLWNLPRVVSIVGAALSVGSVVSLYVVSAVR
jgi:hypothetical protein